MEGGGYLARVTLVKSHQSNKIYKLVLNTGLNVCINSTLDYTWYILVGL